MQTDYIAVHDEFKEEEKPETERKEEKDQKRISNYTNLSFVRKQ